MTIPARPKGLLAAVLALTLAAGLGCRGGLKVTRLADAGSDGRAAGPDAAPGDAGVASANAIGHPCDLTVAVQPTAAVFNTGAPACPTGLCLKPVVEPGAIMTAPAASGTCSAECNDDADCAGELRDPGNALDPRCTKGFACGIPFVVGPLCCKKLCMCKDFLGPDGAVPAACDAANDYGATCSATTSNAPGAEAPRVAQETDIYVALGLPHRLVDFVVMVDNSPSMAPKVAKLNAAFPRLLQALQAPDDGVLPDLRLAILDSDLGTGGAYASGPCGPKILVDGSTSPYGDLGRFQVWSSPNPCTLVAGAQYLEYAAGAPLNYRGDLATVFGCLAGNLGTYGCGEEHQLQAFEFGLVAQGIGNEGQQAMIRPNAQLALVFLTDEDDCSAATNDGMFGAKPDLGGESPSLRCATRGHACGGVNLSTDGPGYPTTSAYVHPFRDCAARTDSCPNPTDGASAGTDTSVPTDCSPLKDIQHLASELKALKADPDNQILVAGIFGLPLGREDIWTAEYKIAPVPNPDMVEGQHPTVYDYWPVCYDPDHLPSAATTDPATGFDATAAAWGATGGLRESAFIDEFAYGMKFSACERDYGNALASIGGAFGAKRPNLCLDGKLVDTDLNAAGVQPDCRVVLRTPAPDPIDPTRIVYLEQALPQCPPGATSATVTTTCWLLDLDTTTCPVNGQIVKLLRGPSDIAAKPQLEPGTKLGLHCLTCPETLAGSAAPPGCAYPR